MKKKITDELGAHVSSAGGVRHAPGRAAALDSTVLQLFTKMASRWAEPVLTEHDVAAFHEEARTHHLGIMAAHDSYLINLASPDPVLRARSMESFAAELRRCSALGIQYVVSHPGNATDDDMPSGIARNAEAVTEALELVPDVTVLFETTAGAGRVIGASFEQMAELIGRIPGALQPRIGVCLDTCHVWAAGYDLRGDYAGVMSRFEDVLGLGRLRLFHLNDSVAGLGSRRDRHAHIGEGALGDDPFRALLLDERFGAIPKLLETPKDDDAEAADRRNLDRLRGYRKPAGGRNKSSRGRKK